MGEVCPLNKPAEASSPTYNTDRIKRALCWAEKRMIPNINDPKSKEDAGKKLAEIKSSQRYAENGQKNPLWVLEHEVRPAYRQIYELLLWDLSQRADKKLTEYIKTTNQKIKECPDQNSPQCTARKLFMQLADKNLRDIPMSSSIDEFARKYNAYKQEHARLMAFINRTPSEQLTDKTEKDQQICKEAGIYMEVAEKLKNDKYYKLAAERAKGASCEGEINRELNEKKNKGVIDIKGKSASEVKDILLEKITAKLNRYFGKRLSYNKVAADLSMSVTITKKGELKVARVQVNSNGFECRDQKDRPVSDKAFEELVSGHLNEPEALKFPPFFRPRVFRVAVKISLSK